MANNSSLKFNGMAELREALRKLPEDLAGEASNIIEGIANGAAAEIRRVYPHGPNGNLIAKVQATHLDNTSKVAAGSVVRSGARHAHLFEFGTKAARRNRKGANRGVMPRAKENEAMIPIVVRARKRMIAQLSDLLRRAGFEVGA